MKWGDIVEWTSQSSGITRTKRGVIIEVVPPRCRPESRNKNFHRRRDHESYLVRARVIDGSAYQGQQERIYWPKVQHLRLAK